MTLCNSLGLIDVGIGALLAFIVPAVEASAYDIFPEVSGKVVQEFDWAKVDWSLVPGGKSPNVTVVSASGGDRARLDIRTNTSAATQPEKAEVRTTLLVINQPPINATDYALTGTVAYRDVAGSGYLEMLSVFPDGDQYFSRGLLADGPMARIDGTSGWRKFALPFHSKPGHMPTRLVLNLVMVGGATVELGPVKLLDAAQIGEAGGMLGAVLGTTLGCLGGLIGLLCGMGRLRRLVLALMWLLAGGGLVLLGLGIAALVLRQPFAIFYPLFLCGVIAVVLGFGLFPIVRRRYEEVELRRMQALDAGGK